MSFLLGSKYHSFDIKLINMKIYFHFLLIGALALVGCSEKKQITKPTISDFTTSVYASAEVRPENYYLVYASSPGILEDWFVEVGDTVKKGQLIAQLKNDNSQINFESAELSNQLASEKYKGKASALKGIETEIAASKKQLVIDSTNYARLAKLWQQKIGALSDLEAAQLRYDLTKNRLDNLEQRLHSSQVELKNAYLQSEKNLKVALSQLGDFGVKAVVDGKVFDTKKKVGELVTIQEPIAAIGSDKTFMIEMWVDEVDISKVRIGQKVYIRLDAYSEKAFEASVAKIYPEKNTKNQSFKVEANFNKAPKQLYSGLSGEANIVLNEKSNALILPQEFLLSDNTVLTNEGIITITAGEKNMSHVEILSGVDTNTVIVHPSHNE